MVNQGTFKNEFEEWAPACVQLAYTYADGHEALDRLWVIAHLGATVTPHAAFEVAGRVYEPHNLDEAIPELDCSPDAQGELLDPLLENSVALRNKVVEAGEELPTRIVLRYDVKQEELTASMTYDSLEPGVPEEKQVSNTGLIERWIERLRETGDDSASALPEEPGDEQDAHAAPIEFEPTDPTDCETPFDQWSAYCLQVAYSFADCHDSLQRVWVVAHLGGAVSVNAVYEIDGAIVRSHELGKAIPELESPIEEQVEYLLEPLTENTADFQDELEAAGEPVPTRIVLRFNVADDDVNEDVTYEPLEPGVPEEDQNPASVLHERWVERLRDTGNDAAGAL